MSCFGLTGREKAEGLVSGDDEPDREVSLWCFARHTAEKSKK